MKTSIGLGLSAAIVLVWVTTLGVQVIANFRVALIFVGQGGVKVWIASPPLDSYPRFEVSRFPLPVKWWPSVQARSTRRVTQRYPLRVFLPFWCAVVPVLGASWYFWVRCRSADQRMACTRCDYNLPGNTSGICPECGTEIERP